MSPSGTRRAVIYTRVSLDATGEGRSVERQEEACRQIVAARGWEVVEVCSDNSISAWSGKKRPGLERALEMARAGQIDAIVVWALDRMTRSMVDLENIILLAEQTGVGIVTATGDIDLTTDVGRMVARILAAVARQEVERKAARQRLANAQRAKAGGKTTGPRPFGYNEDQLTIREDEAAAIRLAADDVLAGVAPYAIARRWTEAGLISSRAAQGIGKGWSGQGVRDLLVNPRYVGQRFYRGEYAGKAQWPAILDEDTHVALVLKLTNPSRQTRQSPTGAPETLLVSIAHCYRCGGAVTGSRMRNGSRELAYTCRAGGCFNVERAAVDNYVTGILVARLAQPDAIGLMAEPSDVDASAIAADIAAKRQRMTDLAEAFAAGAITMAQLTAGTERLRNEVADLEGRLGTSGRHSALSGIAGRPDALEVWEGLPLERKRSIVRAMLDIRVEGPGRGTRVPYDPESRVHVAWLATTESPAAGEASDGAGSVSAA